jgi:hypothetical protein
MADLVHGGWPVLPVDHPEDRFVDARPVYARGGFVMANEVIDIILHLALEVAAGLVLASGIVLLLDCWREL